MAGTPVAWSWIQYIGTSELIRDVTTPNYVQHIDAQPNQVLFLPFETAAYLLLTQPSLWAVMNVIPPGFSYTTDQTTTLGIAALGDNMAWGVTSGGIPYFSTTGVTPGDQADLYVSAGVPYLVTRQR